MDADVLLVSEPSRSLGDGWLVDNRGDAAIRIVTSRHAATATGSGDGYAWLKVRGVILVSCYFSPNRPDEDFVEFLDGIRSSCLETGNGGRAASVVVGGDFNSKAPEWGCPRTDRRGTILSEWAASSDLVCVNSGQVPTFVRGASESIIDLTFATAGAAARVSRWEVLDREESLSLHRYISFTVDAATRRNPRADRPVAHGWAVGGGDLPGLTSSLGTALESGRPADAAALVAATQAACDRSLRRKGHRNRPPVYWWNDEVAELRRQALRARRAFQRKRRGAASDADCEAERAYARERRKALRLAIASSRRQCWRKLCAEVDEDPWGEGYRIVTRRLRARAPPELLTRPMAHRIVDVLFPKHRTIDWIDSHRPPTEEDEVPLFEEEELRRVARTLRSRRAAGPDGIPPEAVKAAVEACPGAVLAVLNGALRKGSFPDEWKHAKLVLLRKPNRTGDDPGAFRPICLLDAYGKLYELLLRDRLSAEIERTGGLADNQYGFRPGRGTSDAIRAVTDAASRAMSGSRTTRKLCAVVTFDCKNAFNNASWRQIIAELRRRGVARYLVRVVQSYFSRRTIEVAHEDGSDVRGVFCGVPQGSVLGPLLWIVFYDGVLRLLLWSDCCLVGYADDLALVAAARTVAELKEKVRDSAASVAVWIEQHGLQLAVQKTEALVFAGRRRLGGPVEFDVLGTTVSATDRIKYLGVWLDKSLSFGVHVREASAKAARTGAALARLMPNVGGPRSGKRRLLAGVVTSTLLYAADVWEGALRANRRLGDVVFAVQRRAALRVSSAYRTVSREAALVVAGMPPIDLLARERARTSAAAAATPAVPPAAGRGGGAPAPAEDEERAEEVPASRTSARAEARRSTMDEWQRRWETAATGRWTFRIIPDVRAWMQRDHGELGFHLAQALTGHGCFRAFLRRIGKLDDDACRYCAAPDTAEHTLFECPRWQSCRPPDVRTPEEMGAVMLQSEEGWNRVATFVDAVLRRKERDEREDRPPAGGGNAAVQ